MMRPRRFGRLAARGLWLPLLLTLVTLGSCDDAENLYVTNVAHFFFDNSTHNDATLAPAMTPHGGTFATVTLKNRRLYFTNNQGLSSEVNLTAPDVQRYPKLGYNYSIIVGYGNSVDGTFYAYDRECPNCFSPTAIPVRSYPVSVDEFGKGKCAHCGRSYDLNSGGFVSDGDAGKKLTRYYATTTGPYGTLSVQ
jgi:nitrite reductase/ring-hydroxylating ferredoxin subunit